MQRPTSFFMTAPLPCPYLEGKVERRMVTELSGLDATSLNDTLSRVGFRRSHGLAYTPMCHECSACLAVRTVVDRFEPSTSQRRVLRLNSHIIAEEKPAEASTEQYKIFSQYQSARHTGGDMETMDFYDYQALGEETPVITSIIEFHDSDGKMIGGCLVDIMTDGLSAVYSFFDPEYQKNSLGTFIILWLIERARQLGLPYVYLGYWISGSQKMAYKDKFLPLQYFSIDAWKEFDTAVFTAASE
jgi:arginyl-tRNA--protein-N-Asp/Glu arginylyltransferase